MGAMKQGVEGLGRNQRGKRTEGPRRLKMQRFGLVGDQCMAALCILTECRSRAISKVTLPPLGTLSQFQSSLDRSGRLIMFEAMNSATAREYASSPLKLKCMSYFDQ